jgi:hypothetical protein
MESVICLSRACVCVLDLQFINIRLVYYWALFPKFTTIFTSGPAKPSGFGFDYFIFYETNLFAESANL